MYMVTLVTSHATYPTRVPNYSRVAKQGNNHRQLTLIGFGFCISHPTGQFDLNEKTFENTWLIWNFVPPSLPSKYWFWISCLLAVKTLFLKPVGVKKNWRRTSPKTLFLWFWEKFWWCRLPNYQFKWILHAHHSSFNK